jgi:hypothetical protein
VSRPSIPISTTDIGPAHRPEADPLPARHDARRVDRWIVFALLSVPLLAVAAVLLTRVGGDSLLLGDEATIGLRVRDVFGPDTPLVGAYSRGFNHPGPGLFWALAPLSTIAGGAAWASVVGAALLHGIAIVAATWVGWRRGGVVLAALVLAALGLTYAGLPLSGALVAVWNPVIALPFFMLFLVLTWSLADGVRWQLVGAVVIGSFLVQAHVGYVPVVVAALVWAALSIGVDARRQTQSSADPDAAARDPSWRSVCTVAAVALAVLWVAPVVQQLTRDPGNVSAMVSELGDGAHALGWSDGAGIVAGQFVLPPPWLGGAEQIDPITDVVDPASVAWLVVPVVLLAIGFLAAHRSGRRADRRLVELAAVTLCASIVAVARVDVAAVPYLFYWRTITATFVVLSVVMAVVHWLGSATRPLLRYGVVAVAGICVVVGFGSLLVDVVDLRDGALPKTTTARAVFDEAARAAPANGAVLVRGLGGTTDGVAQGLVDDLDRRGVDVRVDPRYGFMYGDQRTADVGDVGEIWYVTQEGRHRAISDLPDGGRVIAYASSLSSTEERELARLQRRIAGELEAAGRTDLVEALDSPFVALAVQQAAVPGVDRTALDRLATLNAVLARGGGCRCTVIAYPADAAPDLPFSTGY